MDLSQKQLETIDHLRRAGTVKPEDIIKWCENKLLRPRKYRRPNAKSLVGRRKYGKAYYQGIKDYIKSISK